MNKMQQPQQKNNGRVNLLTPYPATSDLFSLYDKIPVNQCATFRNTTEGLWEDTVLSTLFFSKENMEILQNGIRAGVYHRSNQQFVVGNQNCETLKTIMRSVFLQHSANNEKDITEQIKQLNQMVLNYAVPQVFSEAQGYMQYLVDASTLVVPIAHPILAKENDKELVLKPWF